MKPSLHHRDTRSGQAPTRRNTSQLWLSLCLCVSVVILNGCLLRGKPKVAAAPPPPTSAGAPVPGPISIPQTQVQLPPPQPVSSEALETAPPPQETTTPAPSPPPRPARRTPAPQPKTEAPAAPPPAAPVEPPRAPINEIVPQVEQERLQASAQANKREIQHIVAQARMRSLTKQDRTLVNLILSFVKLSDDAERRGDMRQADELAARGLVLAKELPGGK